MIGSAVLAFAGTEALGPPHNAREVFGSTMNEEYGRWWDTNDPPIGFARARFSAEAPQIRANTVREWREYLERWSAPTFHPYGRRKAHERQMKHHATHEL